MTAYFRRHNWWWNDNYARCQVRSKTLQIVHRCWILLQNRLYIDRRIPRNFLPNKNVVLNRAICLELSSAYDYSNVIMSVMASQITSVSIVCSAVCSGRSKKTSKLRVTALWWIPLTKSQWRGKCFHLITTSWNFESFVYFLVLRCSGSICVSANPSYIINMLFIDLLISTTRRYGKRTGSHI